MIHSEIYRIRNYETDRFGKLSLFALANYLQDIADRHAILLGVGMPALAKIGLSWVLHRMKINIERWPTIGEMVTLETHPSGLERVFVFRDFRMYDQKGVPLITASSTWLVFDTHQRKLTTPANHFKTIFEPYKDFDFLPRASQKLAVLPSEFTERKAVEARHNEIDTNAHVNNSVYFQWLLEPLTAGYLDSHVCTEIDIQFKKECQKEDVIWSQSMIKNNTDRAHQVLDAKGNELASSITRWKNKER